MLDTKPQERYDYQHEWRPKLATLRVPERLVPGIVHIAELEQEGFDQLLLALKNSPAFSNIRELLAWIGPETPSIPENERSLIISAIIPMLRVQRSSDVSGEAFAGDVWDSIIESTPSIDGKISRDLFTSRILLLISESALDLASSRIGDAKSEVERNFCKVKIMTDLRPAFRKNLDELPSEIAVIHNFQIGYHDGMGKHQEFYLALDAGDLALLKKAIDEAEKKVETLERLLSKSAVTLYR